jgi:hypothetical protein
VIILVVLQTGIINDVTVWVELGQRVVGDVCVQV